MIKKKILSGILCSALLFSSVSAAKLTFSDVENEPGVAWAKEYINEMAERGYIKGYEDGTFKPNNTISKTEALILMSRMVGVNDDNFADSVEYALDDFEPVLDKYSTKYPEEISFLLYTGILHPSDLDDYISNANKNEPLKRYEAAMLLTKLMGAEQEVTTNAYVTLSYADTPDIPDFARPYVGYVKDQGIMQGMGNNNDGEPEFWPNSPVTRSQMAKMLYMLIDVLDVKTASGVISDVDSFNDAVTITVDGKSTTYPIAGNTQFKVNGENVEFEDMAVGMNVKVTQIAGQLAMLENVIVLEDTVVYGLVAGTKTATGSKSITIADANDTSIVETFVLAENAKIKVNGAIDLFSKVKTNNYVSLTIEDGLVTELSVIDKSSNAVGTLESMDASGDFTILNVVDKSGNMTPYEISADGVVVSRNNLDSNLSSLMEGDAVTLKLVYGKVTKISATSKNQNLSGKIESITHTTSGSSIVIEVNGKSTEYKVNKSASVLINSTDAGTVYDLRPGTDISLTIESSEIVSIKASATVEKSSFTGTITKINTVHNLIVIEEGGVEYSVYCTGSTKIIDSLTAKTLSLKNVEKGRTAIITGSNASGVLEATAIVLQ